jgi:transposase
VARLRESSTFHGFERTRKKTLMPRYENVQTPGKKTRESAYRCRPFPRDFEQSAGPTKKTPVARERDTAANQAARKQFIEQQEELAPRKLVFLDESGFRLDSPPRHGWAPIGEKAPGKGTHGKWTNMTMIGAVALDGFRGFLTIEGGTTSELFNLFVEHELVPNLRPGDIVVMDNLSAHKNPRARALIEAAGADVLYLPPYSPEFNPIEKAWAKIKGIIRRLPSATRELFDRAVARAMTAITNLDIRGWTRFAGYKLD